MSRLLVSARSAMVVAIATVGSAAAEPQTAPMGRCEVQALERSLGIKWDPTQGPLCVPPVGSKTVPSENAATVGLDKVWGVPPPERRPVGAIYATPIGLLLWTGAGWTHWHPANEPRPKPAS